MSRLEEACSALRVNDWTTPGVYEVASGVHRIPLPLPHDGLRSVNVYAIVEGDGVVLVDGGWALAESEQQLERALGDLGHDLGSVKAFYVTHAHRDHYTQASVVRARLGTKVALGAGERDNLEALQGDYRSSSAQLTVLLEAGADELHRRLSSGERRMGAGRAEWAYPDEWLENAQRLELSSRTLTVIETPGHTRGHVVFADCLAGLLFAGDHVLPHITPSIAFEPVPSQRPLRTYLNSLALLKSLPDARLLPAHGPVGGSVHDRVDALLDHHAERLDECECAVAEGADSAYAVASLLTWTRRRNQLADLDVHNAMLAVVETAAHLDVLAEQRRLRRTADGGRVFYNSL